MRHFIVIIFLLLLQACQANLETTIEVDMYNASGDLVGTAVFTEQPKGVEVHLKVEGLSPGFHGVHIHEQSLCENPDFKSAGNHFNPENKKHGLLHPEGSHIGDLPNAKADDQGTVDVNLTVDEATLLAGKTSLIKNGGTSLIITENSDDGMSQPSGSSGLRLICGEIKNKSEDHRKQPTDPTEVDEDHEGEDNDDLL